MLWKILHGAAERKVSTRQAVTMDESCERKSADTPVSRDPLERVVNLETEDSYAANVLSTCHHFQDPEKTLRLSEGLIFRFVEPKKVHGFFRRFSDFISTRSSGGGRGVSFFFKGDPLHSTNQRCVYIRTLLL